MRSASSATPKLNICKTQRPKHFLATLSSLLTLNLLGKKPSYLVSVLR
jgi:hypothetical protein